MNKWIYFFTTFISLNTLIFSLKSQAQWVQLGSEVPLMKNINAFTVIKSNIFAGTYKSGVYLSTNNGTSWTQTSLDSHNVNCFLTINNKIFAGTNKGLYYSTNNGTTWSKSSLKDTFISSFGYEKSYSEEKESFNPTEKDISISALAKIKNNIVAGSNYYGLDDDNTGGIYYSSDNGDNWTKAGLNGHLISSFCVINNNIFSGSGGGRLILANDGGIYLSSDNGINWSLSSLTNQRVSSLAISSYNILAGVDNFGSDSGGVYISTNNGNNWNKTALNHVAVRSIEIDGNNIFVGTVDSGVFISTNNGISWSNMNQGFSVLFEINTLFITNGYIFAGTNGHSIWRRSLYDMLKD